MSGLLSAAATAWLLDTLLAFSVLVAVVLLIRRPVARIAGAEAAYMLWLIPALRWLVPPLALPHALQPFAARSLLAAPESISEIAAPLSPAIPESTAQVAGVVADSAWDASALLAVLWLGGALVLLSAALVHYARLRRSLARDARALGQVGAIRLFETMSLSGPVATGLIRPTIFVPAGSLSLPVSAQEMALAHEVTHHRAGHLWHNLAALALLSLNWFNPLAWLAWRAFVVDQEAACDARTLARYGFDRADYAEMLVAASRTAPRLLLPAPGASLITRKSLLSRIRSISMGQDMTHRPLLGLVFTALGAALLLPLTASVAQSEPDPASDSALAPTPAQRTSQTVIKIAKQGGEPVLRKKIEQPGERIEIWTDHPISDAEADRLIAESRTARIAADRARVEADKAAADADGKVRIRTRRIIQGAPTEDCAEDCGDGVPPAARAAEDEARRAADAARRQADWARAEAAQAVQAGLAAERAARASAAEANAVAIADGARAEARAAAARVDAAAIRADALAAAAQGLREARADIERTDVASQAQRAALRALAEAERDLRRRSAQ